MIAKSEYETTAVISWFFPVDRHWQSLTGKRVRFPGYPAPKPNRAIYALSSQPGNPCPGILHDVHDFPAAGFHGHGNVSPDQKGKTG